VVFDAELWLWDARRADAWVFVGLPVAESDEIGDLAGGPRRGFGSLRCTICRPGAATAVTTWPRLHCHSTAPRAGNMITSADVRPETAMHKVLPYGDRPRNNHLSPAHVTAVPGMTRWPCDKGCSGPAVTVMRLWLASGPGGVIRRVMMTS
jgi:hypothetical protein